MEKIVWLKFKNKILLYGKHCKLIFSLTIICLDFNIFNNTLLCPIRCINSNHEYIWELAKQFPKFTFKINNKLRDLIWQLKFNWLLNFATSGNWAEFLLENVGLFLINKFKIFVCGFPIHASKIKC